MRADGSNQTTIGSGFANPSGVAVDNSGHVVVADTGNRRIVTMNGDGSNQTTIGTGFFYPLGVTVDSSGRLFVADFNNNHVVSMNADGSDRTTFGPMFTGPSSVAFDTSGHVFVADTFNNQIVKMDADGSNETTIGPGFYFPLGVAVDSSGNIFVADTYNSQIVKVDADGSNQTTIGSGFNYPQGVAVDGSGHVLVSDTYNNQIVSMNADGSNQTTIGSGFSIPQGVAVDGSGHVLVSDTNNDRIIALANAPTAQGRNRSASVSWSASARNGGSRITGYVVTATPMGTGRSVTASFSSSATSGVIFGLKNGRAYTFSVAAKNRSVTGPRSLTSNLVVPSSGAPDAPAAPKTTAGDGQIKVAWSAPDAQGSPITSYVISATPSNGGDTVEMTVAGDVTSAVIYGLVNTVSYDVTVTASNDLGDSAPSPSTSVTPIGSPDSPVITAAALKAPGSTKAIISWSAPDDQGSAITSYTVTSSPGSKTCTAGPSATKCKIKGLTKGATYSFSITATNAIGTSDPSEPFGALTP